MAPAIMENLCIVRMYDRATLSIWKQLVIVVHTFQDEQKIDSLLMRHWWYI